MVDQRLVDYIRENLQRGYPLDFLKQTLVIYGWNIDDIEEAINVVQGSPPASTPFQLPPSTPSPAPPAKAPSPRAPSEPPSMPLGATLICILGFLLYGLMLVSGVLMMGAGAIMGGVDLASWNQILPADFGGTSIAVLGAAFGLTGILTVIIAAVALAGFYLLLKMKKTGWIIVIIIEILSVALAVTDPDILNISNIARLALSGIIIGYLVLGRKLFF